MDVEQVVREYINKTVHMSLGTSVGDQPWVCEVHFAYDNDLNIYFSSLKSRRHSQEIETNPKVAGNIIDKYALGAPVVGVYFEGTARRLTNKNEREQAFRCMQARLSLRDNALEGSEGEDGHQFYKITVKNWYVFGRFGKPSGEKYSLAWNPKV